jgi:NitT/TauT family transport system ATP-binding protein
MIGLRKEHSVEASHGDVRTEPNDDRSAASNRGIECVGLTHRYGSGGKVVTALENISITVEPGELAVLLGPSGCGKTTLLNLIAGFLSPSEGEIRVNGRAVGRPSPDRMVVFQSHALFDWMTVEQNIRAGMFATNLSRREQRARASELVRLVHLTGFERTYPSQLSGGMQQRAGVARALAPDPSVLLLDEPFGALDSLTREQLQDDLLEIFRLRSVTGVLVTHSIEEAVYLGDVVHVFTSVPGRVSATWRRHGRVRQDRTGTEFAHNVRDLRQLFETVVRDVPDDRSSNELPSWR